MPSDESNVKALSLIDQAVKMDQEKDLEGALTLYKSGISSYAWILSFLAIFQNKRDF